MEEFFIWVGAMILTMAIEIVIVGGIFVVLCAPFYLPGFLWRKFKKLRTKFAR
jgi:hypothetical protein